MNYFKVVSEIVCSEIQNLIDEGKLVSDVNLGQVGVETTRDPAHGDLASNAAMVLAKSAKTNPKELGQLIIDRLVKRSEFEFVSLAGPGFINLKMVPKFWTQIIPGVLCAIKSTISKSGYKVSLRYTAFKNLPEISIIPIKLSLTSLGNVPAPAAV